MIHIPKFEDIILNAPTRGFGVAGLIHLRKGKNLGYMDANTGLWIPGREVVTQDLEPFTNIITNTGLDDLADTSVSGSTQYAHVGTGTNTEGATDTALQTHVASVASPTRTNSVKASAPYYGYLDSSWRFGEGAAEGNIAEIGFGPGASNTGLFSRARVKDGGGSPTTITVLSDEFLDVSYQFRLYPDHINSDGSANDGSGSIDISGTSYAYTIRPSEVNSASSWNAQNTRAEAAAELPWVVYGSDAALGAVTSSISATLSSSVNSGYFNSSYTGGTYSRNVGLTLALGSGNLAGGIAGFQMKSFMGAYQVLFASAIPKDATKILTMNMNLAWSRATIT